MAEKMTRTEAAMPLIGKLLDREWNRLLKPLLMKRMGLYLKEIEAMQQQDKPNG